MAKLNEMSIDITARLTVDTDTYRTCIRLMNIYLRDRNMSGLVLKISDLENDVSAVAVKGNEEMKKFIELAKALED